MLLAVSADNWCTVVYAMYHFQVYNMNMSGFLACILFELLVSTCISHTSEEIALVVLVWSLNFIMSSYYTWLIMRTHNLCEIASK